MEPCQAARSGMNLPAWFHVGESLDAGIFPPDAMTKILVSKK
jgi:hypothetical protein